MTGAEQELLNAKLFSAIIVEGSINYIKDLIAQGADVRSQNNVNETPLHLATWHNRLDVVKILCESGADVEARDQWDFVPLHRVIVKGYIEIIKYLVLERNALIPIDGMFKFSEIMKEKMGRETETQGVFDYFLQNKSRYKPEEIQEFKKEFLDCKMGEEDSKNFKSIVKFL